MGERERETEQSKYINGVHNSSAVLLCLLKLFSNEERERERLRKTIDGKIERG